MDSRRKTKIMEEEVDRLRSRVSRMGSELGVVEVFLLILIIFTFATNIW